MKLLAKLNFLLVETAEVMPARVLDRGMKGRKGLHNHFSLHIAAPGAPGYLGEQLERTLAGAEIRRCKLRSA